MSKKSTKEEVLKIFSEKHGNKYDYTKVNYKNKLIFVATFKSDNLIQYCSAGNFEILGGLEKILNKFESVKHVADCRYFDNNLIKMGFEISSTLTPTPWYFKDKFKRFDEFFERCDRIWDCGYFILERNTK